MLIATEAGMAFKTIKQTNLFLRDIVLAGGMGIMRHLMIPITLKDH